MNIKYDVRLLFSLYFKFLLQIPVLSRSSISFSLLDRLLNIRSSMTPQYFPRKRPCRIALSSLRSHESLLLCGLSSSPTNFSSSKHLFDFLKSSLFQVFLSFSPFCQSFLSVLPTLASLSEHKLH